MTNHIKALLSTPLPEPSMVSGSSTSSPLISPTDAPLATPFTHKLPVQPYQDPLFDFFKTHGPPRREYLSEPIINWPDPAELGIKQFDFTKMSLPDVPLSPKMNWLSLNIKSSIHAANKEIDEMEPVRALINYEDVKQMRSRRPRHKPKKEG